MSDFAMTRIPTKPGFFERLYRWWVRRDLEATRTHLTLQLDDLELEICERERLRAELHWTRRSPKADRHLNQLRDHRDELQDQLRAVQGVLDTL